ncbi:glycosyltransferase [Baekduia soli]|uniref:Glycosyltransferase n=1 Tax=Baekduia soli TaxID=496014 RepID=A0A5B8U7Q5_9ACTN|nr:glycosyltransferase [Baekduia soli]QEC49143.1 glycosyltransferase [Baekduia soli]
MKLLYVTAEVPWPLTSGYLRHFHFLRGLSARHDITHLSLTRRPAVPQEAWPELAPYVDRLQVFGEGAPGASPTARSLRLRRAAGELRRAVAAEMAGGGYDAVLVSGKDTFPVLSAVGDTPLVIDVCDAASIRLAGELAVTSQTRRRAMLRVRLAEIRSIERRIVTKTPHLLFASERDREAVGARSGTIVPNGVDLEYWTRGRASSDRPAIAFSGAMAYRPNDDAAQRLVRGILPLVRASVPDAGVILAGRDPLARLRADAQEAGGVTVTGTVDDLRPHLEEAAVYCAPLRFAAGIQNKLLEALAMELPVVTTPIAAAGLVAGSAAAPVVIAEDDTTLAAAIVDLLADPAQRERRAAAGRAFVVEHFSWPSAVARVDAVLHEAAGRPATASVAASAPGEGAGA